MKISIVKSSSQTGQVNNTDKKIENASKEQKLLPKIGVFSSFSKIPKTGDFVVGSWIKWE